MAAVRVHGPRDAEAYSEAMKVINNMGSDPADRKRLVEAGGFEGASKQHLINMSI